MLDDVTDFSGFVFILNAKIDKADQQPSLRAWIEKPSVVNPFLNNLLYNLADCTTHLILEVVTISFVAGSSEFREVNGQCTFVQPGGCIFFNIKNQSSEVVFVGTRDNSNSRVVSFEAFSLTKQGGYIFSSHIASVYTSS